MLLNISSAISLLVTHSSLSSALLSSVVDYTLHQLSNELPEVRQSFLAVVTQLPVDSFQRWDHTAKSTSSLSALILSLIYKYYTDPILDIFTDDSSSPFTWFTARLRSQDLMKKQTRVLARRRSIMTGMYGSLGVEQFRSVATMLFKQYTSRYVV